MPVSDKVIDPMLKWFGKPMAEGKASVYYEVLRKYSDVVLDAAMEEFKGTWKYNSFPQPGIIKELCDKYLRKNSSVKSLSVFTSGKTTANFWDAAERIMKTPVGKLALQENWAMSLVHSVMNGQANFDNEEISKLRNGHTNALAIARSLDPKRPGEELLLSIWHTFQRKEQQLIDKYKYIILGRPNEDGEIFG